MYSIMAVKISSRNSKAPRVQEVLTKHGCIIITRVGFHETSEAQCATDGFVILQLHGQENEIKALYDELKELDGVTPKMIEF
ncbi:MAG: hypothetical protein AB7C97_01135 [Oscillospiraceae bacterium]